jgi:hypothetical protein
MLAKIKLWGIAALGILSAILYGLLRVRSSELEVEQSKNKILEDNKALSDKSEKAEDKILNEYWEREQELVEAYDSKFKQANKVNDSPFLSSSSLELLNDSNEDRGS